MADSIDCTQLPQGPIAVPGYGQQTVALRAGYAASSRYHASSFACGTPDVVVDVSGSYPKSDVLDIETGDATPGTAPGWVRAHNAQTGSLAVLYCNRSTQAAVRSACAAAGLAPGRDFLWWIATLDGTASLPDMTGVAAVQAWGSNFFSRNIDVSVVYDDGWKPTQAGGPLMALTDAEQAELLTRIRNLDSFRDWGFVPDDGSAFPNSKGELTKRIREIDAMMSALTDRPAVDVTALAAALVPLLSSGSNVTALAAALAPLLSGSNGPTKAELEAALQQALAALKSS
jgi:hypothetical protein